MATSTLKYNPLYGQIESGSVTWNTTNVDGNAQTCRYYKIGRLVIANLEFTPKSGTIASQNVICSGLPVPLSIYATNVGGNTQQMRVNSNGELIWWWPTDTTTLKRIDIQIIYLSAN